MNVIYLDQPTAKTMTDMKGLLEVYRRKNIGGKFDDAIEKYETIYDNNMKEVLGR